MARHLLYQSVLCIAVVNSRLAVVGADRRHERSQMPREDLTNLAAREHLPVRPRCFAVERHELDEPKMETLAAAERCQRHDLPFGEPPDGDGVDADRAEAGSLRGGEAREYAVEPLPPRDPLEDLCAERIEADVEPMQAGAAQRRRLLLEQQAVGRERHLLDAGNADELPYERVDAASQQRLPSRDPKRTDALACRHADHPRDLLVAEQFFPWLECGVERHAIRAAEIAVVGDADPQVGMHAAEPVDELRHDRGALGMDPSAVAIGPLLALPDRHVTLD